MAKLVLADGSKSAKIAIVGEAPGQQEEVFGRPFVGSAGNLLEQCMHSAGIARAECYLTNVIKERPYNNIIDPFYNKKGFSLAGINYVNQLKEELSQTQANVIVAVGNTALAALCGKDSVSKWRGSVLESTLLPGRKVIPIIHPAAALREYLYKWYIIADLRRVRFNSTFPEIRRVNRTIHIRPSFNEAVAWMDKCITLQKGGFDIEVVNQELSCFAVAASPTEAMVIPFTHRPNGYIKNYWTEEEELILMSKLNALLNAHSFLVVGQNTMFDTSFLTKKYGIITRAPMADTMIGHHVTYYDFPKGLDFICSIYADEPYYKDEGKIWKDPRVTDEQFWYYNGKDACVTLEAWGPIEKEMLAKKVRNTYDFTINLFDVLLYMQMRGIAADKGRLDEARTRVKGKIKELQMELDALAKSKGMPFDSKAGVYLNINSPKQCQQYFYIVLGHKSYVNRKTGSVTTDDKAMTKLERKGVREATLVKEIRGLRKLESTYLDIEFDPDGRLRCSFNAAGTTTGRLSSSQTIFGTGCNFQNLPSEFKTFLVADKGFFLAEFDKRQAEWVETAYLSNDANMMEVIEKGLDAHVRTAQLMYNAPIDLIEKESKLIGNSTDESWIKEQREKYCPDALKYSPPLNMSMRQAGKKCLPGYAEVLTPYGWRALENITTEDSIAQWDMYSISFTMPSAINKYEHTGIMYRFEGNHVNQVVTDAHRMPTVHDRRGALNVVMAHQLHSAKPTHWSMPISGKLNHGESLLSVDQIRFLAMVQADGTIDTYGNIIVRVEKERKLNRAKALLDILELRYTITNRGFFIHKSNQLVSVVSNLIGRKKLFGSFLLVNSQESLAAFIKEVPHWDGYAKKSQYFTTVKENAEWVQTVAHLTGRRATIKERPNNGLGSKPIYWVKIGDCDHTSLISLSSSTEQYNGYVYCPTVQSGFFLVRINGKISVTGNSNHGFNYDLSPIGFSDANQMALEDSKRCYAGYHRSYAGIKLWYKRTVEELQSKNRTLETFFGRRRWFADRMDDTLFKAAYAYRPQSTVADLVNIGLIAIYKDQKDYMKYVDILGQVHDSVLIQYPIDKIDEFAKAAVMIKKYLEPTITYGGRSHVIATDMKIGPDWGKAKIDKETGIWTGGMREIKLTDNPEEIATAVKEVMSKLKI